MKKEELIEGEKYKIPSGVDVWLEHLRETVVFKRDVIVKITSKPVIGTAPGYRDVVYGIIQTAYTNLFFEPFIGQAATVYMDKKDGVVGVDLEKIKKI